MAENDLSKIRFDNDAIPRDVPNNSLDDVDDMTMRQQRKERFSQDTRFRKYLAIWVMWIVPVWLLAVIVILILCGIEIFSLKSNVLITLLATTTVNVLGLAYIVLKGLFTDPQNNQNK